MNIWLKRSLYLFLLLSTLGVVMFVTMPVQFMVIQFGLPETLRVGGITGTIWSGRASEVTYRGKSIQFAPKNIEMDLLWRWCPGWYQGPVAWCIGLESPLLKGNGTFAYSLPSGVIKVFDAHFRAYIQNYPINIGSLEDKLKAVGSIHLEKLSFNPKDIRLLIDFRADGEVSDLTAQKNQLVLGNYLWNASLEEDLDVVSNFSGGNDQFKIKGQASLNLKNLSYRYTADIDTVNSIIQAWLKPNATKSSEGKWALSGKGELKE